MAESPRVEPITFTPLYMERVWGGRELESYYQRELPPGDTPIGEAWEIVDRAEHQSVVNHGPLEGKTLHELWSGQRQEIFGDCPDSERFPLLIKILDAREDLSIQVHPPTGIAQELGGASKSEMWHIASSEPGSFLYLGVRTGINEAKLREAIEKGDVADQVHRVKAQAGQSTFIPSGRLHAIGGGFLIHEVQENSDTTYRVYDWNRLGLDGKPRELHIEESMRCINFDDQEPRMMDAPCDIECDLFSTKEHALSEGDKIGNPFPERFSILTLLGGMIHSHTGRTFRAGDSFILPKGSDSLIADSPATVLQTVIP